MSTDQTKTLPCPFCGDTDTDFKDGSTHRWGIIYCMACGCEMEVRREYPDIGKWHADAVEAWNRRAPSEALAELAELKGRVEALLEPARKVVECLQTPRNGTPSPHDFSIVFAELRAAIDAASKGAGEQQ